MLDRVPLLEKHLDDYAGVVGVDVVDQIRELAKPLQGARVLHVNATAYGGGVAELLATHVPLLRSVGIDADWQVMHGSDEFFAVTKAVHNGLQGADIEWTPRDAAHLPREGARQRAAARGPLRLRRRCTTRNRRRCSASSASASAARCSDTTWIWRCHIDLTDANPKVWEFFRPFVELHDASVWTMPEFVPASLDMAHVVHGAAVHRPAVGEEPRAGDAVLPGAHQAVRRRREPARSCARSAASTRGRTRSA